MLSIFGTHVPISFNTDFVHYFVQCTEKSGDQNVGDPTQQSKLRYYE